MSTELGQEYRAGDWEHGLRCAKCDRLFNEGDRYSEELDGFIDEHPITLIVCVGCALGDGP